MNLALLSHEYPPHIFGGQGTFTHALAQGLVREGIDVHVIAGYPASIKSIGCRQFQQTLEDGINVIRLPYLNVPLRFTNFQLLNIKKISQIIQDNDIDVIHGQCPSTFPAIRLLRRIAPVLVTFHSSPMMEKIASVRSIFHGGSFRDFYAFLVGYPVWNLIYRKELQYSDVAVSVSRALKSELLEEMGERYEKKILSIHNGVNIESLDKEYEQVRPGIQESENTVLFAGRLFWRKGALSIIRMASLLQKKKSRLKIIVHGTGPLFNTMQKNIGSLGLNNIDLKGFTTRKQLIRSMKLCKFIAIPSIYEACPMILLEGMCLGKIPLMLNLPFSLELTEKGKYGVLADNLEGLTDRLIELNNKHDLCQLSDEIRIFARNSYDIKDTVRKYLDVYRGLSL